MKMLVSGATGFIGTHLVSALLDHSYDVHVIVRDSSDISKFSPNITIHHYENSIESMDAILKNCSPDIVIHLASLFISQHKEDDIVSLIRSNIEFGTILIEAMSNNGCTRLINTGTSWQHYNNEEYNPVNLYAATKQAFEDICRYYVEAQNFKILHLHLFDSYGPDDTRPKLLNFLKKIANSDDLIDMSPGEQEILLVNIKDLINGYLIAINVVMKYVDPQSQIYTIGNKDDICNLRELIESIKYNTGYNFKINWGGKQYRKREVLNLWRNFKTLPGWENTTLFEQGLKEFFGDK